ncbi:MAG: MBL fold metallo-hydrolase [Lachnospiraceae bacterium]|nr:MBL fold metallo-hydrolase [Lachnospiraceae bacterium]
MDNYFLPLGGANEVGASSYFVSLDGVRMIFDAGARIHGMEVYPDYHMLLNYIDDYGNIDFIFLSHAHYDHIGSYHMLGGLAGNAEVLATKATKEFTKLQLLDFGRMIAPEEKEVIKRAKYRQAEAAINRIKIVPVMKPMEHEKCTVTFYPAGHMAGAAMIEVRTADHVIFYSGDFSVRTMFGVNQMRLGIQRPDIFLMNATNAYQSHKKIRNDYADVKEILVEKGRQGKNVLLSSRSIAKHLDLFYFINQNMEEISSLAGRPIPVYITQQSEKIGNALTDLGYLVYNGTIKIGKVPDTPHILIGEDTSMEGYDVIPFDLYSLHASYQELKLFIKNEGAKVTYLLHAQPRFGEQNLVSEFKNSKTFQGSVIQARNEQVYRLP